MRVVTLRYYSLFALLVAGVIGATAFALRHEAHAIGRKPPTVLNPSNADRDDGLSRIAGSMELLAQSVAGLTRRVEALETTQQGGQRPTEQAQAANEQSVKTVDPVEDQQLRRAQERKEALERLQVLEESFRVENREQAWARPMSAKLESAFKEGGFTGTQMVNVDCKTTFCRMEVTHENAESSTNFELFRRQVSGSYYMQHLEPDANGQSRSVVYVLRKGHENDSALGAIMTASR